MEKRRFFLGGADAEMGEVRKALEEADVAFSDAGLGWGAAASAYGDEIAESANRGETPVLVELEVDCPVPESTVVIDHHGERAGERASLLQVLDLLGAEPTRWQRLVAANDAGYIPAMLTEGATRDEVARVRAAERSAQGITPEQEREAERAIAEADAEAMAEAGELVVTRLAHSKCATVTDRLFPHWKDGRENLLIISGDGEANFYGDGALCAELREEFEGWSGGSGLGQPGGQAFWGGYPPHEALLQMVKDRLG